MKRLFLLFVLLILTGCAAKTTTTTETTSSGVETTQIAKLDGLIADAKTAVEAKQNIGMKIVIDNNFKTAKPGDYVVFGLLLNSQFAVKKNFIVEAEFLEARDTSNNKLEADRDLMKTWLDSNEFEIFELDNQQTQFVPVIIKIGNEYASGKPVVKGSYKFNIKSYSDIEGTSKSEYDADKTVFITVTP